MFNEESDYSEENASDNENLRSTIFQPFQFEPEQKRTCGNESHEKKNKTYCRQIRGLQKRSKRNRFCHCYREIWVDTMLIISAKIPQCEENILTPAFMDYCWTISHTC